MHEDTLPQEKFAESLESMENKRHMEVDSSSTSQPD